jgi:tetratricopeptide (TPR) repeat protein
MSTNRGPRAGALTSGPPVGTPDAPVPQRKSRARREAAAAVTANPPAAERHLTPEEMAQALTRWQDPAELGYLLVRHLLAHCEACRSTAEQVRGITRQFAHWNESFALAESAAAPELWQRLEALPFPEQLAAVVGDEAYQTWGVCRLLQRLSEEAAARRPPEAEKAGELANLAIAVSCHLESTYDVEWIEDLQARSYALLGRARRLMGELHSAGDAFELARRCRLAGTGYPSVEAEVVALEALLRRDQGQLATAAALLDRVHRLRTDPEWTITDPDAMDRHLGGRALVHRAWCVYHLGQPETAAAVLEQAAQLIDEQREPRLGLALRHGQVWTAIALGRFEAAEALLGPATLLAGQVGDDAVRLRLRRAAARVAAAAGEVGPAKQTLRETAVGFALIDQGVDSALALIELAELCLRTDDGEGLKPLAAELLSAFQSRDVQRSEMAALLLLQQALEHESLTLKLAERLAVLLERNRRPALGWWSGWGTVLSRERIEDGKQSA